MTGQAWPGREKPRRNAKKTVAEVAGLPAKQQPAFSGQKKPIADR
jgi:hypothetical protein